MAFREVTVVQIKEALRRWMKGEGERTIARGIGVDRKTARRYIAAAVELGVERSGNEEQLSEELLGQVVEQVRPHRTDGHGAAWRALLAEETQSTPVVSQWPPGATARLVVAPSSGRHGPLAPANGARGARSGRIGPPADPGAAPWSTAS